MLKNRVMLAKLTSQNRVTLPKSVMADFPGTEYFEVSSEDGRILLTPVRRFNSADDARDHIEALGITEDDIADAVKWARQSAQSD